MEKRRRKIILEYLAGILALAAAITLAWFVPGWYAGWQDSRSMEQAVVSSREKLRFLDSEALDIASRLKLLEDAENLELDFASLVYLVYQEQEFELDGMISKCKKQLERFEECGLIPTGVSDCATMENLMMVPFEFNVYMRDSGNTTFRLPVTGLLFEYDYEQELPSYDSVVLDAQSLYVTVLMDVEKELLYYVSFIGDGDLVSDYLAKCCGYDSREEVEYYVKKGAFSIQDDYSRYDFAGVCGAEYASVSGSPWDLNLDVILHYETFDGHAYRRLVVDHFVKDWETYGFAILFGNEWWNECVMMLCGEYLGIMQISEASLEDLLGYPLEQVMDIEKETGDVISPAENPPSRG